MSTSITWSDLVSKIKGVSIGTRSVSQSNTKDYWTSAGANLTYLTRIDVDATGVYNNGYTAGLNSTTGTASASNILSGKTAWVNGKKITGTMKDFSSSIQTATTSTSDQTKSCYRINNGYTEVVPAIGYWGFWDWSKSCIKIPTSAFLKSIQVTVTSSSSRYNFQYRNSSGNPTVTSWYYIEYNWTINHTITSAYVVQSGVSAGGKEYYIVSPTGAVAQISGEYWIGLELTHPNWKTQSYFPCPVNKSNTSYKLTLYYV